MIIFEKISKSLGRMRIVIDIIPPKYYNEFPYIFIDITMGQCRKDGEA